MMATRTLYLGRSIPQSRFAIGTVQHVILRGCEKILVNVKETK